MVIKCYHYIKNPLYLIAINVFTSETYSVLLSKAVPTVGNSLFVGHYSKFEITILVGNGISYKTETRDTRRRHDFKGLIVIWKSSLKFTTVTGRDGVIGVL
jgi:hypothetical protein